MMFIKNLMRAAVIGVSVFGASLSLASQSMGPDKIAEKVHVYKGILTAKEHDEMHNIKKNMQVQMIPLLKEKRALDLQLKGLIVTPNTKWSDLAKIIEQINDNNAKITSLVAQTQLTSFQKLGVLLPHRPHHVHK